MIKLKLCKIIWKEFPVLPYEEFVKIQDLLEDLEDLEDLRQAKKEEENSPSIPLSEVKKMLNLS
ncbi:hypothetical protein [Geminocystis herdmanii]|uniref:hypothetical protein n=1 Tax=Geminocystis herdmanii TaxID=669359 RepID=UPI000347F469|nr:hypothetical protein [Geminocystis herdmanii]